MGEIKFISVHQTETPFPDTVTEARRLRGIQSWHQTNEKGPKWGDIAYHYLIGPTGKIYRGRSEKFAASSGTVYLDKNNNGRLLNRMKTAKTVAPRPEGVEKPGASNHHLTISVIGTFHKTLPDEKVRESLTTLIAEKLSANKLSIDDVFFHKEIACWTDCPGQALYDWFRGPTRKRGAAGPGLEEVRKKTRGDREKEGLIQSNPIPIYFAWSPTAVLPSTELGETLPKKELF